MRDAELKEILSQYHYSLLKRMAARMGADRDLSKKELIGVVAERIVDPDRIRQAWERCSPKAKDLLLSLRKVPSLSHQRTELGAEIRELLLEGLVLGLSVQGYGYSYKVSLSHWERVFVPDFVWEALEEDVGVAPSELDEVIRVSPQSFVRKLLFYWRAAEKYRLRLTLEGRLYKRDWEKVAGELGYQLPKGVKSEFDVSELYFLRLMAERLGVVRQVVDDSGESYLEAGSLPALFQLSPRELGQRLLNAWVGLEKWDELGDQAVRELLGLNTRSYLARSYYFHHIDIAAVRRWLLERLKDVGGGWCDLEAYVDALSKTEIPQLEKFSEEMRVYGLYSLARRYDWDEFVPVLFFHLLDVIFSSALLWMGVVEVGMRGSRKLVRLTPYGRMLLDEEAEDVLPVERGQVIVQPNLHVVLMEPIMLEDLVNFELFAERVRVDVAAEYRLTRESVYGGLQYGWSPERIEQFLRSISSVPLPENVVRTLRDWGGQQEQVMIHRRVAVLEADDAALLDQLVGQELLSSMRVKRISDRLLLLDRRPGDLRRLSTHLAQDGYLLLQTRPGEEMKRRCLRVDEAGEISFAIALPSFYVHNLLVQFADPLPDGRYRLTEQSVQRACRQGRDVQFIEEALERLCVHPLPWPLVVRLRRWGGYYGRASLEEVFLLWMEDKEATRRLLTDPELRSLVHLLPGESDTVLYVRREDIARVRELLIARGILDEGR